MLLSLKHRDFNTSYVICQRKTLFIIFNVQNLRSAEKGYRAEARQKKYFFNIKTVKLKLKYLKNFFKF